MEVAEMEHRYRSGSVHRKVVFPEKALRAVVYMRHAPSIQDGKDRADRADETRTLTSAGEKIARACRPHYTALNAALSVRFGEPVYLCSGWPRALLTLFLATGAWHIIEDRRLRLKAWVGRIEGGPWENARKEEGWTVGKMLTRLSIVQAGSMELWGSQPICEAINDQLALIEHGHRGEKLTVMCGHEDMISIMAGYICPRIMLPEDALGLKECQGFVFFLDRSGEVCGAHRFEPTPTLSIPDEA